MKSRIKNRVPRQLLMILIVLAFFVISACNPTPLTPNADQSSTEAGAAQNRLTEIPISVWEKNATRFEGIQTYDIRAIALPTQFDIQSIRELLSQADGPICAVAQDALYVFDDGPHCVPDNGLPPDVETCVQPMRIRCPRPPPGCDQIIADPRCPIEPQSEQTLVFILTPTPTITVTLAPTPTVALTPTSTP